jgi:glycerophosphoryl diester phosphodiesterase
VTYRPLVISHAGCAGHAPEDTLAGVRKAIELGADAVEVDVRTTNEGIPVVIHDATVQRTTGETGYVHAMNLEELKRLNAAAAYPGWEAFEPIPTLEEVVRETRGKILLVIEVKRPDIEGSVLEVIRMNRALDDVMIWSTHPQVVGQFRTYQPSIPAALLMGGEDWTDVRQFFAEALWRGAQACSVHHSVLTPELAHEARLRGLGPYTGTVNEEPDLRRVLECGVLGVVTDYPDRLHALLDAEA